jgi:hypothetical protein
VIELPSGEKQKLIGWGIAEKRFAENTSYDTWLLLHWRL